MGKLQHIMKKLHNKSPYFWIGLFMTSVVLVWAVLGFFWHYGHVGGGAVSGTFLGTLIRDG